MPLSEAQEKQLNKNGAYWQKRFEALTESQFNKADDLTKQLKIQYAKANKAISEEINAWYGKFAKNNKVTLQEARKLLTSKEMQELKWDLDEYIKKGETLNYTDAWAKQLKNASARVHLSRLEALNLQMRQHCEELYALENEGTKSLLEGVYEDEFYRDAFEVQKGTGVGYTLNKLDAAKVETFVMSPWAADGKTFSDRIWASRDNLVNQLRTGLTQALIRGQNPEALIKDITHKFSVRASEASRLVYTETAFFVSAADKASYNELGLEKYQILATLDSKTSAICRDLDGEVFNMSEYKEGITAPPFHPNCRTTTVPYFDDDFDLIGKRAARGEDGTTYTVPANTNYKEWKRAFVDSKKPEKHGFMKMNLQFFAAKEIKSLKPIPKNQAVQTIRKESKEWIDGLSKEEKTLFNIYTYNPNDTKPRFYERINTFIRNGFKGDKDYTKQVEIMSNALKRSKLKHDYICYRGSDFNPFAGMKSGEVRKANQFLSASVIKKKALNGKYKFIIYSEAGVNAGYLEEIAHEKFASQKELLFDKDVEYELLLQIGNIIHLRAKQ